MERGATTSSAVAPGAIRCEARKAATNYWRRAVETGFSEVVAGIYATGARVEDKVGGCERLKSIP